MNKTDGYITGFMFGWIAALTVVIVDVFMHLAN